MTDNNLLPLINFAPATSPVLQLAAALMTPSNGIHLSSLIKIFMLTSIVCNFILYADDLHVYLTQGVSVLGQIVIIFIKNGPRISVLVPT